MSHIFDALQKSEAECVDSVGAIGASVNDILARAELRVAEKSNLRPVQRNANKKPYSEEGLAITRVTGHAAPSDGQGNAFADLTEHVSAAPVPVLEQEGETLLGRCKTLHPVLLPKWRLVSCTDSGSAAAEAFRLLAVRLRHIRKERQLKRLLITSTVPQEGKSLTSANLACTFSARGTQRVLLLEGDVHRPSLTQTFGLSKDPGLCEFLQGHCTIEQCIYRLAEPEIWIFPAGRQPSHPTELIQSPRMPALMEQLDELFDWIVIDSPPILPMADTIILSRLTDGILLVTRRGFSEKKILERGLQALETNKLLGAVINSSRRNGHSYYYYYGAGRTPQVRKIIRPNSD